MPYEPIRFIAVDPREFDGTAYEVADRAVAQAMAVLAILETVVEGAQLMARNAEMGRRIERGREPDAAGWELSAEGKAWAAIEKELSQTRARMAVLRRVAGFNPRSA